LNDQEQVEKFRAALITAVNLCNETRKDTTKLQVEVLAVKNALSALDPAWNAHYQQALAEAEKALANKKSLVEIELENTLGEVVHLLDPNENKEN
jgi:hypothetical protein